MFFSRGGVSGSGRSSGEEMDVSWPERKSETNCLTRAILGVGEGVRRIRRQKETRVVGREVVSGCSGSREEVEGIGSSASANPVPSPSVSAPCEYNRVTDVLILV